MVWYDIVGIHTKRRFGKTQLWLADIKDETIVRRFFVCEENEHEWYLLIDIDEIKASIKDNDEHAETANELFNRIREIAENLAKRECEGAGAGGPPTWEMDNNLWINEVLGVNWVW